MTPHPLQSHQRQIHLDFHTSPFIPDVGCEFSAEEFAKAMKEAHVNSVTIFAKCHHGQCYYPTTTGQQHPALNGRDLLGEQIEALHRQGIRCPIYTTVAWEEDVAQRHPEWRMMRKNGLFAQCGNADFNQAAHPGGWRYNNFLHPDYQDYIEAHIREILGKYEVDGFFFDIVFFDNQSCWSDASLKFREKHGLLADDIGTQARFESEAQAAFARRFTKVVHDLNRKASLFYNSTNPIFSDSSAGVRSRQDSQTHWELESLPSGFWGYHHFPRLARAMGSWGKPWLGMTGRFQRMWGDFGGLKPLPALEYECFRSQALGGANSIGDQLPPRGKLDRGAYALIGTVFRQCAEAEPFYAASFALPQVGIIASGHSDLDGVMTDKSLEGVVQMCEEAHYDAAVLDDACSLNPYDLIILPDYVIPTPKLVKALKAYAKSGGKIILSHRSAFDQEGDSLLGLPLQRVGEAIKYPTYWRAKAKFSAGLSLSDRVVYLPGENIRVGQGVKVLVERVLPYFQRTDLKFSSHFQTPPQARADRHPAVVEGDNFIYFADPIFREYRESGNIAVRDGWKTAMKRLIGPAPFGSGLPTTVLSVPRRRGKDLLLTLLHYIPTRKALNLDMIEERSSFAGEILKLPPQAKSARLFGSNEELPHTDAGFALPMAKGRLLLEVPCYFK